MEAYAASAKAKAIACSSTEIRFRCDKKDRSSDGKAGVRRANNRRGQAARVRIINRR